jgi:hypothetical protein
MMNRVALRRGAPHIRLGGGALLLLAALAALTLPTAASATSLPHAAWHLNGAPLTESEKAATSGEGTLAANAQAPFGGTVTVECKATNKGSAGAFGAGEITTLTATSCTSRSTEKTYGCKDGLQHPAGVVAVHLPWRTELVVVGKTVHERIVSGGSGTPGFKLKCWIEALSSYGEEECVGTLGASITNTESGFTTAFEAGEKLLCNGSSEGWLEGSQKVTSTAGKLTAEADEAEWQFNGSPITEAKNVTLSGSFQLSSQVPGLGRIGVHCEDTGKGKAGSTYKGEITSLTFSNCSKVIGTGCESAASIEALHLPWSTELATVKSAPRNYIVSSGKGAPEFVLTCKTVEGMTKEYCRGQRSTAMANASGKVTATYSSEEKFSCSGGLSGTGELTGTQTILLEAGGSLEVL